MPRYEKIKNYPGIRKDTTTKTYNVTKSVNGKRYTKVFKSLKEAKYWKNNFHPVLSPDPKNSVNPSKRTDSNGRNKSITFFDIFEKYKKQVVPTLSEQTVYRKINCVQKFMSELMDINIADINAEVIGNLILKKKAHAMKFEPQRFNFNRDLKETSSIIEWYRDTIDDSYRNPIKKYHRDLGKIKELEQTQKKVSAADFVTFINAFTEKQKLYRDIAVMQFYAAGRIHEVAGILVKNIDLANRTLKIKDTVSWVKKQPPKIKPTTKTGEIRFVWLNDSMMEIVKRRMASSQNGLLFHRNGEILRYNAIQRNYNKALHAANLPYSGTHILRHSMATTTRKLFNSIDHAQSVTGHKSIRMLEHYAENEKCELNKSSIDGVEKYIEKIKGEAQNAFKCVQDQKEVS